MTYENGGQLDRALKRAVRDRGGDPGDGCRRALRDRFLRRVFSNPCVSSRGFEQKEHRKLSSLSIGSAHAF